MQAYENWVNSQLRKRPGLRHVNDLSADMRDGCVFGNLIEILGGGTIEIIPSPTDYAGMISNIEEIIRFMQRNSIRMHNVSPNDIVNGNAKAIMRLVLALAAYYKPNSVRQSSKFPSQQAIPGRSASYTSDLSISSNTVPASKLSQAVLSSPSSSHNILSDSVASSSPSQELYYTSPVLPFNSPSPSTEMLPVRKSKSMHALSRNLFGQEAPATCDNDRDVDCSTAVNAETSSVDPDTQFNTQVLNDVSVIRKSLLQLQRLFLSSDDDENLFKNESLPDLSEDQQMVVLTSRLQQSYELIRELRGELSQAKNEYLELQSSKVALQQRLASHQEQTYQLKADNLQLTLSRDQLEIDRDNLSKRLKEYEESEANLKRLIIQKDAFIYQLQLDVPKKEASTSISESDTVEALKAELKALSGDVKTIAQAEASISAQISAQERHVSAIQNRASTNRHSPATRTRSYPQNILAVSAAHSELEWVNSNLSQLHSSLAVNDPKHLTIDSLQTVVSSVLSRLRSGSLNSSVTPSKEVKLRKKERKRSSNYGSFPLEIISDSSVLPHTKVLYYINGASEPLLCVIPKRLGEILLRDIKAVISQPHNFRFHFKALDPEFGTVKEELVNDSEIVPGWDNKVVVWIQEDLRHIEVTV